LEPGPDGPRPDPIDPIELDESMSSSIWVEDVRPPDLEAAGSPRSARAPVRLPRVQTARDEREEHDVATEWGPLQALAGEWASDTGGLDTAFSHAKGKVLGTPYLEKATLKPFGPVDNGDQHLYGLDYKTAMWRGDEQNPFHTEVGYWLWDAATGEVLRGFVVPRGITVLAGGIATADATEFTMRAAQGELQYAIGENTYLAKRASTLSYEVTIQTDGDTWSYQEDTILKMSDLDEPLHHTDANTLRRVS